MPDDEVEVTEAPAPVAVVKPDSVKEWVRRELDLLHLSRADREIQNP